MSRFGLIEDRWNALAARERRMVAGAAWLVAAALVWWLALAPALATLSAAEAQHQTLDAQLQTMLALKAEAAALQSQVKAGADDARRAIEGSVKQGLGAASTVQIAGDRATVSLRGVTGAALSNWLVDLRTGVRLLPAEVRLTRANATATATPPAATPPEATPAAPSAAAPAVVWDGSVVLTLAPR